jgi:hypothetical protein
MHESLDNSHELAVSSERSFGNVFAGVFALLGAYRLWHGKADGYAWLAVAAVFLSLAWLWTRPLQPLNRLWARLGALLHRIVTPLMMGLMFFVVITPIGLAVRALGKDLLRLRRDPAAASYWVPREDSASREGAMKDQF